MPLAASALHAMLHPEEDDEEGLAQLGEEMVAEVMIRIRAALMPAKKKGR